MCLSLQGNLYIFIVGHSGGTVSVSFRRDEETENRPLPTMSSPRAFIYKAFRHLTHYLYLSKQS